MFTYFREEINAYCRLVHVVERVVHETGDQGRFPNYIFLSASSDVLRPNALHTALLAQED